MNLELQRGSEKNQFSIQKQFVPFQYELPGAGPTPAPDFVDQGQARSRQRDSTHASQNRKQSVVKGLASFGNLLLCRFLDFCRI